MNGGLQRAGGIPSYPRLTSVQEQARKGERAGGEVSESNAPLARLSFGEAQTADGQRPPRAGPQVTGLQGSLPTRPGCGGGPERTGRLAALPKPISNTAAWSGQETTVSVPGAF